MKILNATQIKEADRFTIENEPISSIDLMERASKKCVDWIVKNFDANTEFAVFCGVGNNGGDGLVISRLLSEANYSLQIFIVEFSSKYSDDFAQNLEKLKKTGIPYKILNLLNYTFDLPSNIVIIDAIFGSGLNKPLHGFVSKITTVINRAQSIISIDMPSGIFCENNEENNLENVVKATYTLTFQQPKLAMMFPCYATCFGEIQLLDIGLKKEYLKQVNTPYYFTTKESVSSFMHIRQKFSHKGTFGHSLLIAGSKGKMGAALLSAKSCLRTGAGLATLLVPKCGVTIVQTALPEAMCISDEKNNFISSIPEVDKYNAIGVGPGIGTQKSTQNALKLLIQNSKIPLVIDADALNILSENKTWLAFLPPNSVLTPHPKEFQRIVGKWESDEQRLRLQQELAVKNQLVVVLKGAYTSIALPNGEIHFNSSGNAGMATAGSGDVLTGIITSLVAQGYAMDIASIFGVYLHGVAGDFAKEKIGEPSMIASDIIENIPLAFGWINS
ncbi:MAG: NAD(P)H-hydrate dehydratase [Flavobacteriales bacterium]|nr:NAD(P)H-hydrate dehydratase [Flavobacteriales bacterium]